MMGEEAGRVRHGDALMGRAAWPNKIVARNTYAPLVLLGGFLCMAVADSAAQDGLFPAPSASAGFMEQALRVLRQGLADRAKEFGRSGTDPLTTGSLPGPVPRLWIVPIPLPQAASIDVSMTPATGRDVERLFDPRPLGPAEALHGEVDANPQALRAEPPTPTSMSPSASVLAPATPPVASLAVQSPAPVSAAPDTAQAATVARAPDPVPDSPATPPPAADSKPSATAALDFPVSPPTTLPPREQAHEADSPSPKPTKKPSRSAKPPTPTTAVRQAPKPRERSARRETPPVSTKPNAVANEKPVAAANDKPKAATNEIRERHRAAAKPSIRSAAIAQPEVTGSIDRKPSPRAVARELPIRSSRGAPPVVRPVRTARQQPSDIPVIALPEALRPTRPSAGSPL